MRGSGKICAATHNILLCTWYREKRQTNPSVAVESANHYIHTRLLLTRNICTWKEQVWTKILHNYCTGKKFGNNLTAPSGNFPSWSSLPWLVPPSLSLSQIKKTWMSIFFFLLPSLSLSLFLSPVKPWILYQLKFDLTFSLSTIAFFLGKCHILPIFFAILKTAGADNWRNVKWRGTFVSLVI